MAKNVGVMSSVHTQREGGRGGELRGTVRRRGIVRKAGFRSIVAAVPPPFLGVVDQKCTALGSAAESFSISSKMLAQKDEPAKTPTYCSSLDWQNGKKREKEA